MPCKRRRTTRSASSYGYVTQMDFSGSSAESELSELGPMVKWTMQTLNDKLEAVSDECEAVSEKCEAASLKLETVSDDCEAVSEKCEAASEKLETVSERLETVSEKLEAVSDKLDEIYELLSANTNLHVSTSVLDLMRDQSSSTMRPPAPAATSFAGPFQLSRSMCYIQDEYEYLENFFRWKASKTSNTTIKRVLEQAWQTVLSQMWTMDDLWEMDGPNSQNYRVAVQKGIPDGLARSFQDELAEFQDLCLKATNP